MRNELTRSNVESVEGEHLTQQEYMIESLDRAIARHKALHADLVERRKLARQQAQMQCLLNIFATSFRTYLCLGWMGKHQVCVTYGIHGGCYISSPISKMVYSVWELELAKSELLNMGAEIDWDIYQWLLVSIKPREQHEQAH